jgi:phosphoenolpyruvate carboxylase
MMYVESLCNHSGTDTTMAKAQDQRPRSSSWLLERDRRLLGFQLARTLDALATPGFRTTINRLVRLSRARRRGDEHAERKLVALIETLDCDTIEDVIRALSCRLDMDNLAEDRQRIRILHQRERAADPAPISQSIGAAVNELTTAGFDSDQLAAIVDQLDIEMVFTAHPTEAKRRTHRHALRRLRADLTDLDRSDMLPRERAEALTRMQTDIGCLWETDTVRPHRPTVLDEVKRCLFFTESLWRVVPHIYRGMRTALRRADPNRDWRVGRFLRFGTWIGGDRDGHPYVTHDVTRDALRLMRDAAMRRHIEQCDRLTNVLSISQRQHVMQPALRRAIAMACARWPGVERQVAVLNPHEVYRHWLTVIRYRLQQTQRCDVFDQPHIGGAYHKPDEVLSDLRLIADNLRANGHADLADGQLQAWMDQVNVFGFHTARMDVREDAAVLRQVVAEILRQWNVADDFASLDEARRCELLLEPIDPDRVLQIDETALSDKARDTLRLFRLLHAAAAAYGRDALGALVISMTHHPSDVLAMMWLSNFGAVTSDPDAEPLRLPIVPLFETIDDLDRAGDMLDAMLTCEPYRRHLDATGEPQICMIGYSDGTKDGGYLAANWYLYQAQDRLARVAKRHGTRLCVFHGRGGALGRGGGPAARGILALPPRSVNGLMRVTEQGEVLADRYDDPHIAHRHLEQVVWATMRVTADVREAPEQAWTRTMNAAAGASLEAYRAMAHDPAFTDYFEHATPINRIEDLPIGSRPSRRGAKRQLSDLRAIPYTFAWMQSRHLITAFYGLGAGLCQPAVDDIELLQTMYRDWPTFRGLIENAELAMAKADVALARHYAALVPDRVAAERIFGRFREEFERTRDAIARITGHEEPLAGTPWLRRSIRVRNPVVDVLNLLQVELMRREADGIEEQAQAQLEVERMAIQGIATGLRTTG